MKMFARLLELFQFYKVHEIPFAAYKL